MTKIVVFRLANGNTLVLPDDCPRSEVYAAPFVDAGDAANVPGYHQEFVLRFNASVDDVRGRWETLTKVTP